MNGYVRGSKTIPTSTSDTTDQTRAQPAAPTIYRHEAPHQQTLQSTNVGNAKPAAHGSEANNAYWTTHQTCGTCHETPAPHRRPHHTIHHSVTCRRRTYPHRTDRTPQRTTTPTHPPVTRRHGTRVRLPIPRTLKIPNLCVIRSTRSNPIVVPQIGDAF